jgi:hypothetical protein
MSQTHRTGSRHTDSTTDERSRRRGVMRRLERRAHNHWPLGHECTCHGVDGRHLEHLTLGQRRQQTRKSLGEKTLAGAWCPMQQQVVPSRCGDLDGQPRGGLTVDVAQIGCILELEPRAHRISPSRRLIAAKDRHHLAKICDNRNLGVRYERRFAAGRLGDGESTPPCRH